MATLIIGGTSGLGYELALALAKTSEEVYVTGRREFDKPGITYKQFDLAAPNLPERMHALIESLPTITTLIYAAGYFQDGRVTDLSTKQIEEMIDVGGRGLIYTMKEILTKQGSLSELVTITSTSQWTPREREPIYNFVKAGVAHFSNAMTEDGRVGKVLVAGPAGMDTAFWDGVERDDTAELLSPEWAAKEVMSLREGEYKYRFAKILREPARVEIIETR
jgi:short-subunit dehydrogenase